MSRAIQSYGKIAEITGTQVDNIKIPSDTEMLRNLLLEKFPELKNHSFLLAVNRNIVNEKKALSGDEEIAIMPPFSGG
ncbi:MAG: MoaD/ThiS family protein [Bacteroidetes bacterium]|nr:MAG: MoaD/ThiS family protein [Bacteroidota bacterium]REK00788.1 MAG: MoaD/ThiS family protein [Bacteroidota bacterium]REK35036.1 MAG: MoaD/ThiS family protein [Bacteroidota bacterium]REK48165.1 MAG: MoaD/ThiS family protein [Bacteroidota bacterium]